MSTAVNIPWPSILSDAATRSAGVTNMSSADILQLHRQKADVQSDFHSFDLRGISSAFSPGSSISEQDPPPSRSDAQEKRLPNVADWKGTLDLVNGMTGVAEDQRNNLKERTEAQQRALEDLQKQVNEVRQRLHASERRTHKLQVQADSRLQRTQAHLDAQVEETRAETEARVRAISAQNAGLIRTTGERVRAAELRAQTAEAWLQQIDTAAKNLLLNGHMNRLDVR